MKIAFNLLIIIGITLIFACDEKDIPLNPTGKITINSVMPEEIIPFDTVIINGEFFGLAEYGRIILPDNSVIAGKNCLEWQFTVIKFVIPKNIPSGDLFIIAAQDTSDTVQISTYPIPRIDTVFIPSGSFDMGSLASSSEIPIHNVNITKEFYISKYEVNQRLYETVMNHNPSIMKDWSLPVDSISWLDAVKFCNSLSIIEGLDSCYSITGENVTWLDSTNGWRLPTEAEWEYACRGGAITDISGSGVLEEMGWYNENSGYKSHPSGYKKANDYGVYDMHGNLWEWCWDNFSRTYYQNSPEDNPLGPATGTRRVLRGGSYSEGRTFARSSNRDIPSSEFINIGIRLVRNDYE